jgi:hypothetical protein
MHYVKFGVNIILVSAEGLWHLGSLFYHDTHSIHNGGDLQIHFSMIFGETRRHTKSHLTSGTFIHSSLSLAMRTTQTAVQLVT